MLSASFSLFMSYSAITPYSPDSAGAERKEKVIFGGNPFRQLKRPQSLQKYAPKFLTGKIAGKVPEMAIWGLDVIFVSAGAALTYLYWCNFSWRVGAAVLCCRRWRLMAHLCAFF